MNPFDLTGPSFLIVYWTLAMFAVLLVYWLRLRTDVGGAPAKMVSDPYALAFMRAGYPEVVRVALLTLVEDGVIAVDGMNFKLATKRKPARRPVKIRRPEVEEALIAHLSGHVATLDLIVISRIGHEACENYRQTLEDLGYLRQKAAVASLGTAATVIAILVAAIGFIKIGLGLSRGRNVGFLVISGFAAVAIIRAVGNRPGAVTARGKRALEAAQALLSGARQRLNDATAARGAHEVTWLAAAFGFSILGAAPATFAYWPAFAYGGGERDRSGNLVNTPSGSSCSSSCSTASSCSSSCGGGGCGGGCGGCGS